MTPHCSLNDGDRRRYRVRSAVRWPHKRCRLRTWLKLSVGRSHRGCSRAYPSTALGRQNLMPPALRCSRWRTRNRVPARRQDARPSALGEVAASDRSEFFDELEGRSRSAHSRQEPDPKLVRDMEINAERPPQPFDARLPESDRKSCSRSCESERPQAFCSNSLCLEAFVAKKLCQPLRRTGWCRFPSCATEGGQDSRRYSQSWKRLLTRREQHRDDQQDRDQA
jgi:hypothetical protein